MSATVLVFAACSSESSDDDDASGGEPTGGSGGSAGAGTGGSASGASGSGTGGSVSGSSSGGTGGGGAGGGGAGGKSGGASGLGGTPSGGDAGASSGSGGSALGGSGGVAGNGGRGGNPSSTCPETPPDDASSCGSLGLACVYEDCAGDGRTVAQCQAAGWDVEDGACAAPMCEADDCDAGDICVITTGGTVLANCVPNPCGTGPVNCECVGCERCTVNGSLSSGIVVTCSP